MVNARGMVQVARQKWFLAFLLAILGVMSSAPQADAHPMGNFSISHYTRIRIEPAQVELLYLLDMAEIPTFQELQESEIVPESGHASLSGYLAKKSELLKKSLRLEINGRRLALNAAPKEIIFPAGAGGLPTLKLMVIYRAALDQNASNGSYLLHYKDQNYSDRAGWKEIVVETASGVSMLTSSAPERDRSGQLSDYPTDVLNNPPQDLEARVSFTSITTPKPLALARETTSITHRSDSLPPIPRFTAKDEHRPVPPQLVPNHSLQKETERVSTTGTPTAVQLQANRQSTPRNSFTELMATKQLGLGMIFVALAVAAGLGAFHALEPGHGKTLVAAYLVGARGTMKHAFLLGLIVTAAHTAGVYLLGGITLYASQYIVPDRLYPWLAVVSGVMITVVGLALLIRRCRRRDRLHSHQHHHDHPHSGDHHHHHGRHHHVHSQQVSLRELLTLGISGGIVPCPAALVVLLSAVSMQRIGFGLLLIIAFSIGLAAVLISIGILMVYARQFMARFHNNGPIINHWLPLTSSAFILLFGVMLTVQALQTVALHL